MNLLSRLLNRKKQNPYYIKLNESLIRKGVNIDIKSAYFLFGIPYNESNFEELKKAVAENRIKEIKENRPYDVRLDNIELFLIQDADDNRYIIFLLDPYELYETEQILEIMPVETKDFEKEIIFP